MIVVIPVCYKDEQLVLKNLDWIAELDGKIAAGCNISIPADLPYPTDICDKAKSIFAGGVLFIRYDEWKGNPKWPHPQNWAWQSTARHMATQKLPWLWWEADATPVAKGWYDAIKSEYELARKPFMGCVLEKINGFDPHMAGVGVYPPNVAKYSVSSMLCRAAAFDIVMWRDTMNITHPANHLIQHHCYENGDSNSFRDIASVKAIVRPGVVLFHRCKDGSLIDRLRNPKSMLETIFSPKTVGQIPRPSILKQTQWKAGFFDLPSNNSECHFNCGLVHDSSGFRWLVSRRWRKRNSTSWMSDIMRHRISFDFSLSESRVIELPFQRGPMEQHEDPRIINRGKGFLLGYCSWLPSEKYEAHQAMAHLDEQWNFLSAFHLLYGKNGECPGRGRGHEKNWTWFFHDHQLHLDYQFSPHIVLSVKSESSFVEYITQTPLDRKWVFGQPRGGTPPIKIGDEYLSFFHSSLPWKPRQNRYFMGAYTFDSKPPFAVKKMTEKPILSGSELDPRSNGGPCVVFPCGAIREDKNFLVTLGVNDQSCAWMEIPIERLFEKMA